MESQKESQPQLTNETQKRKHAHLKTSELSDGSCQDSTSGSENDDVTPSDNDNEEMEGRKLTLTETFIPDSVCVEDIACDELIPAFAKSPDAKPKDCENFVREQ